MSMQEEMKKYQDQQIDEIHDLALRLGEHARTINNELNHQEVLIHQLDKEVDQNLDKMNFAMKKMAKMLGTSDTKTLCTIIILMVIVVVLFVLVFYT